MNGKYQESVTKAKNINPIIASIINTPFVVIESSVCENGSSVLDGTMASRYKYWFQIFLKRQEFRDNVADSCMPPPPSHLLAFILQIPKG